MEQSMTQTTDKDPIDRLVGAYEKMLERVSSAAKVAEKKTLPWLQEAVAEAREKAVELGELTREEADKISTYVERDMETAAEFIVDTGKGFHDWLEDDFNLIKNQFLEAFAGMADKTSEALHDIEARAKQVSKK